MQLDHPWKITELNRAIELRKAGASIKVIAETLGRPWSSVRSQMHKHNVIVRPYWTAEHNQILREAVEEVAKRLGRTPPAVVAQACKLYQRAERDTP